MTGCPQSKICAGLLLVLHSINCLYCNLMILGSIYHIENGICAGRLAVEAINVLLWCSQVVNCKGFWFLSNMHLLALDIPQIPPLCSPLFIFPPILICRQGQQSLILKSILLWAWIELYLCYKSKRCSICTFSGDNKQLQPLYVCRWPDVEDVEDVEDQGI